MNAYSFAAIRELAAASFDDDTLSDFCFGHFNAVCEQFAAGLSESRSNEVRGVWEQEYQWRGIGKRVPVACSSGGWKIKTPNLQWFIVLSCFFLTVFVAGCGGGNNDNRDIAPVVEDSRPEPEDDAGEPEPEDNIEEPQPETGTPIPPFFIKPFTGTYYNIWPFDHDLPLGFYSENNGSPHVLGFRGDIIELYWGDGKGHDGYDWGVPEGTPLLAVADGEVVFAGLDEPYPCGSSGEKQALIVQLRHTAPNGDILETLYGHMSRVDVETGETVRSGQQIGLSGNTGCSSGAHLHFMVFRVANTNNGNKTVIDPFGWEGPGQDPWAVHPDGAESVWLWKTGETPTGDYSFGGRDGGSADLANHTYFHTEVQIEAELRKIAERRPDIANLSFIGVTHEGRHIWILKISGNVHVDGGKPAILIMGGSHAREWLSVEIPFYLAEYLANGHGSDPDITEIVDAAEIWILPMLNPDGHAHTRKSDRLWRKNRRPNGDGTFGVDLNRNCEFGWESGGTEPDSEFHRGPAPFSEPETRAARDFVIYRNFRAVVDYHAYAQVIMYPSGNDRMKDISVEMSELIFGVRGKTHHPLPYDPPLYPGGLIDWIYNATGADAWLIETRPDNAENDSEYPWLSDPSRLGPFDPPESEIRPSWEENRPALMRLIKEYAGL